MDSSHLLLVVAVFLLMARVGSLVEKLGQPAVIGELLGGVILGNLGLNFLNGVGSNETIGFLAELGIVILLFQVGLETNIHEMRRVGFRALIVACIGVVLPFTLGYFLCPFLLPNQQAACSINILW